MSHLSGSKLSNESMPKHLSKSSRGARTIKTQEQKATLSPGKKQGQLSLDSTKMFNTYRIFEKVIDDRRARGEDNPKQHRASGCDKGFGFLLNLQQKLQQRCQTIDKDVLFTRRWTFLHALTRPKTLLLVKGAEELDALLLEFFACVEKSSRGALKGTVLKFNLTTLSNLGRQSLGVSNKLYSQQFRRLKGLFSMMDSVIDKMGSISAIPFRSDRDQREKLLKSVESLPFSPKQELGDDQEKIVSDSAQPISTAHSQENENSNEIDQATNDWLNAHSTAVEVANTMVDIYMTCQMYLAISLTLSELLNNLEVFATSLANANQLAARFICDGLPSLERLFRMDPDFVYHNIFGCCLDGLETGHYFQPARMLIRKYSVLADVFEAMDIHIIPPSVFAHEGGVRAISVSHIDPLIIATGGNDGSVRIWDFRVAGWKSNQSTGNSEASTETTTNPTSLPPMDRELSNRQSMALMLAQFQGHSSIVTWCAFNDSDTRLYTASFDGTLREWNTQTAQCLRVFRGHGDSVLDGDVAAGYQSSRLLLMGGSLDKTARIWDLQSPTSAYANDTSVFVLKGHLSAVKSVKFIRPLCEQVVTGGLDRKLMIWNLPLHTLRSRLAATETPQDKSDDVNSSKSISHSHRRNAHKKAIEAITVQPIVVIPAHNDSILDLALSRNVLASCAKDQSVRFWDLHVLLSEGNSIHVSSAKDNPTAGIVLNKQLPPNGWIRSITFSMDGEFFATGSFDNCISIYRASTGRILRRIRIHNQGLLRITFVHTHMIACATIDGKLQLISI